MNSTKQGVYLQFFDEGEPSERELPPLGPFELLIVRHNRIIGDREKIEHDVLGVGSVERWLEAEIELRRALGDEPGGVKRSHMRMLAPRGDIIVRFYDYSGDQAPKVPELGPFYSLVIGKREVRADDKLIAIRSTDVSHWTLTDAVRPGVAGINKADFSVFALSAREEPAATPSAARQAEAPPPPQVTTPIVSAPAPAPLPPPAGTSLAAHEPDSAEPGRPTEFRERRKVQREIYISRPLATQSEEQLTPADLNLILRVDRMKQQELAQQLMVERMRRERHVDPEAALRTEVVTSLPMRFQPPVKDRERAAEADNAEYEDVPLTTRLLDLLWSGRLIIVTLLLIAVAVAAYGYLQPRAGAAAGPPPLTFAAVSDKIQTSDWQYTVVSVERPIALAGASQPLSGGYLVIHITAARKNVSALPLEPSGFTLIDANGARALPFPIASDVYAPSTGLLWATRYPMGNFVHDFLVFDVAPGTKGLLLLINSANIEVRLPDP